MAPRGVSSEGPLSIVLDNASKKVYIAGDRISGHVCFNSGEHYEVCKAEVKLWGHSKTKLYRSDGNGDRYTYSGRGSLFCRRIVLYEGQFMRMAPDFKWPFEFHFPESAEQTPYGDKWKEEETKFRRSDLVEDFLLPSSMMTKGRMMKCPGPFETKSWIIDVHSFDCFVEYKIEASMMDLRSKTLLHQYEILLPFEQILRSDVTLTEARDNSFAESFQIRSFKLDPQHSGRSLSFKEKASSVLGSASVPSAQFEVLFNGPSTIRLGDKTELSLKLNHLAQAGSSPFNPTVILLSVDVQVVAFTSVRSKKGLITSPQNTNEDQISCDVWLQKNPESWDGPFEKESGYTKRLHLDYIHSLGIVPSFATCNINRNYAIKIQCVFECAGKQVKFQRQDPVEMLPGLAVNAEELAQYVQRPSSVSGPSIYAQSELADTLEELPTYEAASGSALPEDAVDAIEAVTSMQKPALRDN